MRSLSTSRRVWTGDYTVDEKHRTVTVTDEGWEKVEKLLGIGNIADPDNWDLKHHEKRRSKPTPSTGATSTTW